MYIYIYIYDISSLRIKSLDIKLTLNEHIAAAAE